jgi:hypothetical protein
MISPLMLKVKRYRCKEWDLIVDEIKLITLTTLPPVT